MNTKVKSVVL